MLRDMASVAVGSQTYLSTLVRPQSHWPGECVETELQ